MKRTVSLTLEVPDDFGPRLEAIPDALPMNGAPARVVVVAVEESLKDESRPDAGKSEAAERSLV